MVKSPSGTSPASSLTALPGLSCGISWLMRTYSCGVSSAGPEMISGVRASSIRMESTSSTMAK
jgi:hypothetical protein